MKKRIVLVIAIVTILAMMSGLLVACNGAGGKRRTPVYQGMSIHSYATRLDAAMADLDDLGGIVEDIIEGDYDGRDDDIDVDDPFKDGDDDSIEQEIKGSLEVQGATEDIYYAEPNADIYITIHIDNPDSYEIMSFTLNGKKYTNYMFERGSDMENIILKYNVGSVSGIQSYTIDAIKYIDGTTLKDVIISGNKTVKAGVRIDNQVRADVSNEIITSNDIALDVNVKDADHLLGENKLYAVLYNGTDIISKKELALGANHIAFDSLKTSTMYEYGIAGYYDDLSGSGAQFNIITKKAFYTKAVVLFKDVVVGQDNIKWNYLWDNSIESQTITSLKLYKGAEEQVLDTKATSIDHLLSNTEYRLVAEYANLGKTESIEVTFKTHAKAVPTIAFKDIVSTRSTINGEYVVTDPDGINTIDKVELYKGETLAKASADKSIAFDTLEYYTDYTIKVSYHYDLGDGAGVHEELATYDIKTQPHVGITNIKVSNTSAVSDGETIYMQATLDNSIGAIIESVVVNGTEYSVVNTSTASRIFVEILNNGQFAGGDTMLTIEKINTTLDGKQYTVEMDANNTANVFINGNIYLKSAKFVNDALENIDYIVNGEENILLMELSNATGYIIDSIKIGDCTISDPALAEVAPNTFKCVNVPLEISSIIIQYHNATVSKTIEIVLDQMLIQTCLEEAGVHYIKTADDLLNMNRRLYYELANDIDLSGREWTGGVMDGLFDGKGFTISNMSFVGNNNAYSEIGLFSKMNRRSVVKNVNIKSATFIVDIKEKENVQLGGISGYIDSGRIENCTIDANSIIILRSQDVALENYAGGIAGFVTNSVIINCINNASISGVFAGGIVAKSESDSSQVSCTNYGQVNATKTAGGITAYTLWSGQIMDCVNYGAISAEGIDVTAGGIVAKLDGTCQRSINYGKIIGIATADACAGGIVGNGHQIGRFAMDNLANYGVIYAEGDNTFCGGVFGRTYDTLNPIKCFNAGSVSTKSRSGRAAGIVGSVWADAHVVIVDSVNVADIGTEKIFAAGGIAGERYGKPTITNCYSTCIIAGDDILCTISQLNDKTFYTDTLGWSEDIWDFSTLDIENGKGPTLKNVGANIVAK